MSNSTATPDGPSYWAFISYSHQDSRWAGWLHKALETWRVPKRLVGTRTSVGVVPSRLAPIFRDRDELASAHDLGTKVNDALRHSGNLIVICSPASAASRWVNEEVLAFKRLGRSERIFCLIVDGEPDASDHGHPAEECFCPALRHPLGADGELAPEGAEPIAADARPGKDGRGNAKLKLIAGALDIGFDALKQREQHRRAQRMTAIAALAIVVMAMTSVLAVAALIARHEAVVSQADAERRQKQAEDLVDFMLGDLGDKLDQMQRLDIMQSVDDKAMAYFQSLPATDVNDVALAQRAKAMEKIGVVRMALGNLPGALEAFEVSAKLASALAAAMPADVARQVAYSRTLAYVGMVHWSQTKLPEAQHDFEAAKEVLQSSLSQAPHNPPLLEQLVFLDNDIGHVLEARGNAEAAQGIFKERLDLAHRLVEAAPDNRNDATAAGDAHNDLGRLALQRGDLATAIAEYRADDLIEARVSAKDPKDNGQRENAMRVRAILGRTLVLAGDARVGTSDLEQAVAMAEELVKVDPENTSPQELLALYASQLARLRRLSGDPRGAAALTARAMPILAGLNRKDASNTQWLREYAEAQTEQAAESLVADHVDEARAQARGALAVLESLLSREPENRVTLLATTNARLLLAQTIADPQAAAALREAALQAIALQKAGHGDPRLLALQVEALLALHRKTQAKPLLGQLWRSGYRDPALLSVLRREHIDYPPNAAFARQLASIAQADPGAPIPSRTMRSTDSEPATSAAAR